MEGAKQWVASLLPSLPLENLAGDTVCHWEELLMAGSLVVFLPFWEEITSDQRVLDIIRPSYSIQLMQHSSVYGGLEHKVSYMWL